MNRLVQIINSPFWAIAIFMVILSSCATTSVDQREVTPELFDPELKNGKIFVFSNHNDPRMIHVRVNDEYQQMKHKDLKIFELNKGKNTIYSFKKYLEDKVIKRKNFKKDFKITSLTKIL